MRSANDILKAEVGDLMFRVSVAESKVEELTYVVQRLVPYLDTDRVHAELPEIAKNLNLPSRSDPGPGPHPIETGEGNPVPPPPINGGS